MNLFIELHQELLRKLLDAGVEFIIIGGYSVIFHGYKRTTGDIDVWLKPDNTNKVKFLKVLAQFDFDETELSQVANLDFTKHIAFSIGEQPEKMDFLTFISLVKYQDADQKKIIAEVDGLQIPFLHLNDLVLSKMNTGRSKDKADIDMLQLIERAKRRS
jgi:predicted nucleotidyltransferase